MKPDFGRHCAGKRTATDTRTITGTGHGWSRTPYRKRRDGSGLEAWQHSNARARRRIFSAAAMLFVLLFAMAVPVSAQPDARIPPELARWQGWVMHGHETELCPSRFDDGASGRCQWPSRLTLEVSDDNGRFEMGWHVFAPGWVELPGGVDLWPDGVTLDGNPTVVVDRRQSPAVFVPIGEHRIAGRFFWTQIPETIGLPSDLGLLALIRNGETVAVPELIEPHKLWLGQAREAPPLETRADIKISRLLRDTIPMQVETVIIMTISGRGRELEVAGALLDGSLAMSVDSPLPARIDEDGRLIVQTRPGRWEIHVLARMSGPRSSIQAGSLQQGNEIWAFEPQHHLRIVEITGVPAIEPSQTEIQADWQNLAAFAVAPGDVMLFREIRRGDPDPPPDQLSLQRTWWLDFSGDGFTIHDRITGTLRRQWHLAVNPPTTLGRVAVNGRDQVITAHAPENKAGVELRTGQLDLTADSRLDRTARSITIVGWDHAFEHVSGRLNLPPGWRLLAAAGIDQVSDTWLQSWTLLDFFLVLIIVLAIWKLRGRLWALLALVLMVLIFKEPGAPRLVWLHLLAVLALLPLLPAGWIKRTVLIWGIGAFALLLIEAIPFAVNQVRWGFYPQLAPPQAGSIAPEQRTADFLMETMQEDRLSTDEPPASAIRLRQKLPTRAPAERPVPLVKKADMADFDPNALIPTGPGLPQWQWRTIELAWSGPLIMNQTMRLYLLSPRLNFILAMARAALLILLIAGFVQWRRIWPGVRSALPAFYMLTLLLAAGSGRLPLAQAAEDASVSAYPPPGMLEELRQRLLEKPDCLPACADISRLEIHLTGDHMQAKLKTHAAVRTAVPLPVNRKTWTPEQVLLDNAPLGALARGDDGQLWAVIPAGVHTVELTGRTNGQEMVQLPLPLKPHAVSISAAGWEVRGLMPDGTVAATLQLIRLQAVGEAAKEAAASALVPFFQVHRHLRLGLTWHADTVIRRLTPPGEPAVLSIPLIDGESITTPGVQIRQDQALIHFAPDQHIQSYSATLPISSQIKLTAAQAMPWVEIWSLDAASVWHVQLKGIAPVQHLDDGNRRQPQWQPWPGESVTLAIDRPPAIAGQNKTIDRVELESTPGRRFSSGELTVDLRTSQGGPHTFILPERANLQNVYLNDRNLPVRQEGRFVTVPLASGRQNVRIQWHRPEAFQTILSTPALNIGQEAVNARLTMHLAADRWILFTSGPRWGPAVLVWSYLAVLLIFAAALGRIRFTPLKTWQWLLLAAGLTQIPPVAAIIIVAWLVLTGLRRNITMPRHWLPFNAVQLMLGVLVLSALVCLFGAVKAGLIGQPQMHVIGNDSSNLALHWTQDRVGESLPQARALSLPVWIYHGLMLIWSLWLALSLIKWLKWTWQSLSSETLWKKIQIRSRGASPATVRDDTPAAI